MTNKKKSDDRDLFGTPKNRSKSWDVKKSRGAKEDRRKSKKEHKSVGENAKDNIEST